MTPKRIQVLKHFFLKKHNVETLDLIRFFFSRPAKLRVKNYIEKIEPYDDTYYKFYFKNFDKPLFYPKIFPISSLNQVVLECFDNKNWHHYEIPETTVLKDDVVVDCGSAEGLFALTVIHRCKYIYLIEPLNTFIKSLEKTFNKCINMKIIDLALSNKEYTSNIIDDGLSSKISDSSNRNNQKIKVSTLDRLFYDNNIDINYIKGDLEGYDFKALKGASELINKNKPKIAITTYHSPSHQSKIKSFLSNLVPEYKFKIKGIFSKTGTSVMLHAWI